MDEHKNGRFQNWTAQKVDGACEISYLAFDGSSGLEIMKALMNFTR